MILLGVQKLVINAGKLHDRLFGPGLRKTQMWNNFLEFNLIQWRMKTAIKRQTFNLVIEPLLKKLRGFQPDT